MHHGSQIWSHLISYCRHGCHLKPRRHKPHIYLFSYTMKNKNLSHTKSDRLFPVYSKYRIWFRIWIKLNNKKCWFSFFFSKKSQAHIFGRLRCCNTDFFKSLLKIFFAKLRSIFYYCASTEPVSNIWHEIVFLSQLEIVKDVTKEILRRNLIQTR